MNDNYKFNIKKERPEELYSDVLKYFKGETLIRYATSKSLMKIQERITIRALEILDLKKKNCLILDAGCGPGFASIYLNELGYKVVALDLIKDFLNYYNISELNPLNADMCFSPFKSNTFDAIISISALQWLLNDIENKKIILNVINLFNSFEKILKINSKIIFQFYPKNDAILKKLGTLIVENTNLNGNYIIDNPESPKKRKIFLILKKNYEK